MLVKIKTVISAIKSQAADIWNRSKIFLFAFVGVIVFIEYQKIKEWLLTYQGQKEVNTDKKEDQRLAATEKVDETKADSLEVKANTETTNDDWNLK